MQVPEGTECRYLRGQCRYLREVDGGVSGGPG